MKRSNLHITVFALVTGISFLIILSTYQKERSIIGFRNQVDDLRIINHWLEKENVFISPEAKPFTQVKAGKDVYFGGDLPVLYFSNKSIAHFVTSDLHYFSESKELYLSQEGILEDSDTQLHIPTNGFKRIRLNNEVIWEAPDQESENTDSQP